LQRFAQVMVAQKVTTGVYKGVTTSELDELAAETAASMTSRHPDYALVRSLHLFIQKIFPPHKPLLNASARREDCRVQLAQGDPQVLLRDVRLQHYDFILNSNLFFLPFLYI
jgi:hypothetical protein